MDGMQASTVASPPRSADALTPKPAAKAKGAGATLADFDEFLNLFVSQLKYQDPLSPMQGEEFLAQTAQFSSVEQLVNINKAMSSLSSELGLFSRANAASLLGRRVDALTDDGEGEKVPVSGRVIQLGFGSSGDLVLGLEGGTSVPLADVVSVADAS
jgi:flagellar basal-body rod modification protein FlgD